VAADDSSGEPAEGGETVEAGAAAVGTVDELQTGEPAGEESTEAGEAASASDDDPRNRRRGRRGGRKRRRDSEGELSPFAVPGADQPELQPVYAGPTPADPFGGRAFDIFDVMDQVERAAEAKPAPRASSAVEISNNTAPEPDLSNTPEPDISNAEPEQVAAAGEDQTLLDPEPNAAILNTAAPEPGGKPSRAQAARQASSPLVPANDTTAEIITPEPPPAEPLVKPILIGAGGEPPSEPKRGWWRR
jgi:ribonuclease E